MSVTVRVTLTIRLNRVVMEAVDLDIQVTVSAAEGEIQRILPPNATDIELHRKLSLCLDLQVFKALPELVLVRRVVEDVVELIRAQELANGGSNERIRSWTTWDQRLAEFSYLTEKQLAVQSPSLWARRFGT